VCGSVQAKTDLSNGFVRPNVAIVDGELLYRWFVAESLGQDGLSVLQFQNLSDAASYLNTRALPGLMLVDAQTVSDQGVDDLVALRCQFPTLPWLVLEASGPGNASWTTEGAAATPKPVEPEALRKLVRGHLDSELRSCAPG
jgi:DNA-binding response OmpR family regulator